MQKLKEEVTDKCDNTSFELTTKKDNQTIDLSNKNLIDLSGLSIDSRHEIIRRTHENTLALDRKAGEATIDLQATKKNLDNFNEAVKAATSSGAHITLTHTQETSVGRTEVVTGNTDEAAKGKISRAGRGLPDNQMGMFIVIAIAVVALALILK